MPAGAIDSLLFKNLFGTEDVRSIFEDKAYIQRCIDVSQIIRFQNTGVIGVFVDTVTGGSSVSSGAIQSRCDTK
jgi:hypothetical protein